MTVQGLKARVLRIVREIKKGTPGEHYNTASKGEKLMAALISTRQDLLESEGYSFDEAMLRCTPEEQAWVRRARKWMGDPVKLFDEELEELREELETAYHEDGADTLGDLDLILQEMKRREGKADSLPA